jgi:hypothetical protein
MGNTINSKRFWVYSFGIRIETTPFLVVTICLRAFMRIAFFKRIAKREIQSFQLQYPKACLTYDTIRNALLLVDVFQYFSKFTNLICTLHAPCITTLTTL